MKANLEMKAKTSSNCEPKATKMLENGKIDIVCGK